MISRSSAGLSLLLMLLLLAVAVPCTVLPAAQAEAGQVFVADFDDQSQLNLFSFTPRIEAYWRIAPDRAHPERGQVLQLLRAAETEQDKVRRPGALAMIEGMPWRDFTLTVELKCTAGVALRGRDLVVVFCYQDPFHFYYVHLSNEQAGAHNVIMKVHDPSPAGRRTIHREHTEGLLTDLEYHRVKVTYDSVSGEIRVYVDDLARPHLTATDGQFRGGTLGIGSFNDTGYFDNLRVMGTGSDLTP